MIRLICLMVLTASALAAGTAEMGAANPTGKKAAGHLSHAEASSPQREALLATAERALALGKFTEAQSSLEAAAQLAHSADTEMLQVRTMMQTGDYRHAVSFAAHTAGAHIDEGITPNAMYAWLLYLGGQGGFAMRMLDEALSREPYNALAKEVKQRMAHDAAPASANWFEPPHRLAPYPLSLKGKGPPAKLEIRGNGTLWNRGTQALVPLAAINGEGGLWVRNGLGQTVPAKLSQKLPELQLAILQLSVSMPLGEAGLARRDPFAGSAGFVADYALEDKGAPAWPRLHPGFLGGLSLSSPVRRLGIALPAGPRGGPVLDAAGKLAGIALEGPESDRLVTIPQLNQALGLPSGGSSPATPVTPIPLEEAYESAMHLALQVIAGPSPKAGQKTSGK